MLLRAIRRRMKRWKRRRAEYADPREYWEKRGEVYRSQHVNYERDGEPGDRSLRFFAEQVSRLKPESVLEVGCGYGALLRRLQERLEMPAFGVDFSSTQLREAQSYLGSSARRLARADAAFLPFGEGAFDAIVTSGVLMHIYPDRLPEVIRELVRVARRWLVHNEDLVRSSRSFGHDLQKIYARNGYRIAESFLNPHGLEKQRLQFVIVDLRGAPGSPGERGSAS